MLPKFCQGRFRRARRDLEERGVCSPTCALKRRASKILACDACVFYMCFFHAGRFALEGPKATTRELEYSDLWKNFLLPIFLAKQRFHRQGAWVHDRGATGAR